MANDLNPILVEGNLVRDPELRTTPKGTAVCTFTLASNRYYRNDNGFEKEVSFFDVEAWTKLAEACYQKGKKGASVRVVGRLRQDRWNSVDGKTHARIVIVAEHVEFRAEFTKNKKAEETNDTEQEVPPEDEMMDESNAVGVLADEVVEVDAVY